MSQSKECIRIAALLELPPDNRFRFSIREHLIRRDMPLILKNAVEIPDQDISSYVGS
jgi:hypothetical protein